MAEFLSFSLTCNALGQLLTAYLQFPKGGDTAQVCGLSRTCRYRLPKLAFTAAPLPLVVQIGSHLLCGGCVGEARGMMEVLIPSWGYLQVRLSQQLTGRCLDNPCDVVSRIHIP